MTDPIRAAEAADPLNWADAPCRIEYGGGRNGWLEALLPLGKDHTLRLYAEREALHLVPDALRAALPGLREAVPSCAPAGWVMRYNDDRSITITNAQGMGVVVHRVTIGPREIPEEVLYALAAAMLAAAPSAAGLREAGEAVARTSERHFALRDAHGHRSEEDYFAARPKLDGPDERTAFRAGFTRGFDAGEQVYAAPPSPAPQGERAQGEVVLASEQRNPDGRPRFSASEDGRLIDDDDFIFDASLRVSGDFGGDEERRAYAQWIADTLNAADQALPRESHAAPQTTEPAPEAGVVEALRATLQGKSDAAYIRYIETLRRDECLGWEAKVHSRKFGEPELKAHTMAAEFLGQHRAFAAALADVRASLAAHPQTAERVAVHTGDDNAEGRA